MLPFERPCGKAPGRGIQVKCQACSILETMDLDIWHVPVPVTDLERSVEFYCHHLGFVLIGRDEWDDKAQAFVAVRQGGFSVELFQPKDGVPRRLPDHLAFECRDLRAYRERLLLSGLAVPQVETFDNGVMFLPVRDPDGLEIEFFQGRAQYEASISPK